ncbi:TPA: DUF1133 family protein [Escherichia coli]
MIYPTNTGKNGEHLRLATLESVWIQGKLRMWGRWSYIGGGKTGNMFNQLLTSKKLTKTAINEALRRMKKAGLDKPELEAFLRDMINGKQKSWLVHCTDAEALCIDRVISEVLAEHPGLICILRQRYEGRGMTKRKMAELLNDAHPEWCFSTCEKRIANWLAVAEYALYIPMRESFAQKIA